MSYFRPEIEAMAGYVPGEQPQDGEFIKLNTNENPYPPSPAVAEAIEEAARRGLAEVSRPDGRAVSPPGGRGAGRRARLDPLRQRQRRHPDDRHAGVRRPGPAAAAAVSELHPLQDAGRAAGRAERRGPLQRRLVAAATTFAAAGRRPAAGRSWRIRTVPRARWFRRERVLETGRAAAVSAAGRRGLRRFRRDELHGPGRPSARRSWSRGR